MFPLSHIHLATALTKNTDPFLILGSVIPDGAWLYPHIFPREEIHDNPLKFQDYITLNFPEHLCFSTGVTLHSQVNQGADFYSDNLKNGFAMKHAELLTDKVGKYLEIENKFDAILKSHNFIEAAVDLLLANKYPQATKFYHQACNQNNFQTIAEIIKKLQPRALLTTQEVMIALHKLFDQLSAQNLANKELMVSRVLTPLIQLNSKSIVKEQYVAEILEDAITCAQSEWEIWIDYAISEMRITFKTLLQ